ncbi:DUF2516 family protein [Corynebacterium sp. 335C]
MFPTRVFTGNVWRDTVTGIDLFFQWGLPMVVGLLALAGVVMVLTTRPDAFDAADRKSRGTWAGLLGASAVFLLLPPLGWLMLGIPVIAGLVITGVYWMDVRPQIRDILGNAQGGW